MLNASHIACKMVCTIAKTQPICRNGTGLREELLKAIRYVTETLFQSGTVALAPIPGMVRVIITTMKTNYVPKSRIRMMDLHTLLPMLYCTSIISVQGSCLLLLLCQAKHMEELADKHPWRHRATHVKLCRDEGRFGLFCRVYPR